MNFSILKKTLLLGLLLTSIVTSVYFFYTYNTKFIGQKLEPGEFLFLQRAYPLGKLKPGNKQELDAWSTLKRFSSRQSSVVNWQLVGPENVGGRITDIAIPSNNPATYYVASASGGIFKSVNAGVSWEPIFDEQNTMAIGDMEISKTNNEIILVGTGEPNAGGGSTNYEGTGVYVSSDSGSTWQSKGLSNTGSIGKVIVDPTNSQNMYVGAMGLLYAPTEDRGVYKSTDGGDTWTKTLFVSTITGVIDMAINPLNPNILYAATWQRTRTPETRVYGGSASNIYKSIDAGVTWTLLTNVLPNTSNKGRISLDISNSNPDTVIISYTNTAGTTLALRKTIDGGSTWTSLPSTAITLSQFNWWFGGIFINPTNSDNVFITQINCHYSNNGGNTWSQINGTTQEVHVDQHSIAFNSNNEILLGNDGGLYRSTNGAAFTKINNLPISQAYRMDVNPANVNHIYAGFQDNGTNRTLTSGYNNWSFLFGGDGLQPRVNPADNGVLFAQYQYGVFHRSIDNGASFALSDNGISTFEPRNWDTPYVFDPANSNIMYFGTSNLYKSVNNGITWTSISDNLSKNVYTGTQRYGTITTIDVSPLNSAVIFIGTDDGNVWKTTDGGNSYTKISDLLPNKWVTKVKASPTNPNQVYVTYSGFKYNLFDSNIYVSNDMGNSWQDLAADLPNTPLNDIEISNTNILYLASDIGVLVSNDLGLSWDFLGINMPSVVITDLVIHESSNFLFAASYGRGIYKIDLTAVNLSINEVSSNVSNIHVYPNPTNDYLFLDMRFDKPTTFEARFYDLKGKLIQNYQLNDTKIGKQTIKMNIQSFQKGIYILKINNQLKSYKIVIN